MTDAERPARPVKRSLTLRGHRTSVSLEDAFWDAFRTMAQDRGRSLNALAAEIDAARDPRTGLASAMRVAVLHDLQARCMADGRGPDQTE